MNLIIRPLPLTEAVAAWPTLSQLRKHLNLSLFKKRIEKAEKEGYKIAVAQLEDTIIGVVGYRFLTDLCWGYTLYVDDLVVHETKRGEGVGQQLMQYIEKIARDANCKHIRLASGISRKMVHQFYKKIGFRATSYQFVLPLQNES